MVASNVGRYIYIGKRKMVASNVGRYIYIGKEKLWLSFLKLIVLTLLQRLQAAGASAVFATWRLPFNERRAKLKSPHLDYSPEREYRIKETIIIGIDNDSDLSDPTKWIY